MWYMWVICQNTWKMFVLRIKDLIMMRQGNSSLQNLFLQFLFVHVSFQPIGLIRRLPFGNGLAVDHFRQFLILCTCLTNHFSIRKQSRHFRHLRKKLKKNVQKFRETLQFDEIFQEISKFRFLQKFEFSRQKWWR